VSAELSDFSIFTSEDPRFEDPDEIIREIAEGAKSAGAAEGKDFLCIENRRTAIESAIDYAGDGDTVLLAGKGHEQCMIYGDQRVPWDEAEEARRSLAAQGFKLTASETEGSE
jgi:UDP-N-acetylmuramoyl-L-alanyl-D-glutamate--2,6-diaminopimelate ligase